MRGLFRAIALFLWMCSATWNPSARADDDVQAVAGGAVGVLFSGSVSSTLRERLLQGVRADGIAAAAIEVDDATAESGELLRVGFRTGSWELRLCSATGDVLEVVKVGSASRLVDAACSLLGERVGRRAVRADRPALLEAVSPHGGPGDEPGVQVISRGRPVGLAKIYEVRESGLVFMGFTDLDGWAALPRDCGPVVIDVSRGEYEPIDLGSGNRVVEIDESGIAAGIVTDARDRVRIELSQYINAEAVFRANQGDVAAVEGLRTFFEQRDLAAAGKHDYEYGVLNALGLLGLTPEATESAVDTSDPSYDRFLTTAAYNEMVAAFDVRLAAEDFVWVSAHYADLLESASKVGQISEFVVHLGRQVAAYRGTYRARMAFEDLESVQSYGSLSQSLDRLGEAAGQMQRARDAFGARESLRRWSDMPDVLGRERERIERAGRQTQEPDVLKNLADRTDQLVLEFQKASEIERVLRIVDQPNVQGAP